MTASVALLGVKAIWIATSDAVMDMSNYLYFLDSADNIARKRRQIHEAPSADPAATKA